MLSVDQCLITIMMAILILLMKLSSKYMEKPEGKFPLYLHANKLLFKKTKKPAPRRREYSLCNATATVTPTTANAAANSCRAGDDEGPAKTKKLCSYMCVYEHMHRYRPAIYLPSLRLDFGGSATERLANYRRCA